MADVGVDTSSYPKPVAQPGLFDQVAKIQNVQNNAISINKNQLDLLNTQFGLINSELSNLAANPNTTKQEAAQRLNNFAQTYKLPPEVVQHMMGELQQAPDVRTFATFALRRGMDVQQKINNTYGQNANVDTGQVIQPGIARSPMQGGGFQPSGQPIQKQLPVGTPGYVNGQSSFVEPGTNVQPPGTTTFPRLPVSGPTGPTVRRPDLDEPAQLGATARINNAASAFTPEPPQLTEEGKKAYMADIANATQKMTAVKPAMEALKLLPGLRTGPGTEPFNKFVAFLKANNAITTEQEHDPTVVYEMANKYFSQYLKGRGGRSDADLEAAVKASPNVANQLNPALLQLTRKAIAQDRIEAARPLAFKGNDYSKYLVHQGSFPQSIDDRAFGLDLMPEDQANKLVKSMVSQYKNGNAKEKREADKFLSSYAIAKERGFY